MRSWPPDAWLLGALAAALPVWLALGWLAHLGWLGPLRVPGSVWGWVSMLLWQPVLEEWCFRGLLQGHLAKGLASPAWGRQPPAHWLGPVSLANGLTTVAFVAAHLWQQSLGWALAVAGPSLLLGHARDRYGSVWPSVGLHAAYNAGLALTGWLLVAHRA